MIYIHSVHYNAVLNTRATAVVETTQTYTTIMFNFILDLNASSYIL